MVSSSNGDSNNGLIRNNIENSTKQITTSAEGVSDRNRYYEYYQNDHDNKPRSNDYDIIFLFERNLQNNAASYQKFVIWLVNSTKE